jgi:hypothetical protein
MSSAYYDYLEMFVKGLHLRFLAPKPRREYGLVKTASIIVTTFFCSTFAALIARTRALHNRRPLLVALVESLPNA